MKSFVGASIVFFFASAAFAQFANNPALTKKPPAEEADKPAEKAPGNPANANDPGLGQPVGGQPAGAAPAGANAVFAALDLDGDGTISKAELRKAVVSLRKLDTDNDGALTAAECGGGAAAGGGAAIAGNDANQWLDRIMLKDKNRDGRLTADELDAGEIQMLQGADFNNDKAIDRQELSQFGKGQAGAGWQGNNFVGGPNGAQGVGRRGNNEAIGQFLRFDRNRDGRLTADEVPQQAMGMLQGGDRNGDGAIDAGEMQAIAAQLGDRAKAIGAGADPNAPGKDGLPGNNRRRPPRDKNEK
jgi:Ca2+-binding EF-hand superfamily protein